MVMVKEVQAKYLTIGKEEQRTLEKDFCPDGYKLTEVGVIPDDWEVCELENAVEFLDGMRKPVKSSERAKMQGIYPYYGTSGIVDFVNNYLFDGEYILLGEDGENILSRNLPLAFKVKGKIWVNNHAHVMLPKDSFNIDYLTPFLESLDYSLLNSGTAQPKLNKQTCLNIKVAKPKTHEQTAIAKALSDVDALITSLEKLIAKKQAIKTATMQQLLTGKKRLPGFGEDWKIINIENHANLKARIGWQALTTNEYLEQGDFYLVTGTDFVGGLVNWSTCHFVDEWRYKQDKNIQLKHHDILLTKDGTIGKVGFVDKLDGPATLNSGVFVIRPKGDSFYPLYLFYILSSSIFDAFLNRITAGSTITHLYQKDFVTFEFLAPGVEEQKAIGDMFYDMDFEIKMLEERLVKTQQIKQGMMQELLRGKTRLVNVKDEVTA